MFLFAGLPALLLSGQGNLGAAFLILVSNIYALLLGRMLLARQLLKEGKVKPEDLS
ncbi:hypothetical protein [Micromonospora rubida]|uniref:hypothetical protein n=1 Tax=Micromonospora rubida TaxID=2697657 RepID=UPI0013790E15|nr:hypothetical protein [Micromonospora rubida]NBE80933.1 hypothetical protein [Micromonospora rubida]